MSSRVFSRTSGCALVSFDGRLSASHGACVSLSASCWLTHTALRLSRRNYLHRIPEDLVPEGATTSRFQSSALPSDRLRVLREYALAPLFGSRVHACCLGFLCRAREISDKKLQLRSALATLLDVDEEWIGFDSVVPLTHRLVPPRRDDRDGYRQDPRTGATAARVLLPVVLDADRFEGGVEEILALGEVLTEMWQRGEAEPLSKLGVSHVEVPPLDESDVTFHEIGGEPVTEGIATEIQERWVARVERQEEVMLTQKGAKDSAQ